MTRGVGMNQVPADVSPPTLADRLRAALMPNRRMPAPINPALLKHAQERADSAQNRVADRITTFAGSMLFVYLHILWFGLWIGFGVEKDPFGVFTLILLFGGV